MPTDETSLLAALAQCTDEALVNTTDRIVRQSSEERSYETTGVNWRTVDQLLTLISYLTALVGAAGSLQMYEGLQRKNSALYHAVREVRRELAPRTNS